VKVFILEFTMSNGVHWANTDYKVTATSMEELEVAVMNILQRTMTNEEMWNQIKTNVIQTELTFPIVDEKIWYN
jgi:hypothetical protein